MPACHNTLPALASAAFAAVVLCAEVRAADPGLATLHAKLTQIAVATRGQLGASIVHVESGVELFSFKGLLPPDTIVAHKTGTTAVVTNDVGLVTLPDNGGHLALAVFVTNGGSAGAMQAAIAQLAAAAYEGFTGKSLPPPPKPVRRVVKRRAAPPR